MVATENQNNPTLPWLNAENITIRAKNRLCFAGTSWCIHADEQWTVIGPTGGGKSIFVKALSGRLPVVHGQIMNYFDGTPNGRPYVQQGEVILVSAETQRDVLQQHAGFHQSRWQSSESDGVPTVAEFLNGESVDDRVTYAVNPSGGMDRRDQAVRRAQAVELLDIGGLLDRKIIPLSNGEGRKVLLARALMQSPKLLILDDPFGGLDADSRLTLIRSLTAILESRQQRLLLVASREEEIPDGITHVLGIAGHKLVIQGPKAEVCASSFARGV